MKVRFLHLSSLILFSTYSLTAQNFTLNIWPGEIPGEKSCNEYNEKSILIANNRIRIYNVKEPQLFAFLPSPEKSTGTAIVILPGGSYKRLAIDHEGVDVAKWLAGEGIAGFVLKYRLPNDSIMEDKSVGPLMDVQESIRIIRRNAKGWSIDPGKIGVMGFSAGGHLAGSASTLFNHTVYPVKDSTSCRPDFSVLIYGALSFINPYSHPESRQRLIGNDASMDTQKLFSAEMNVNDETPPAFLVHAADDKSVNINNSWLYLRALQEHNIPVELHVYQKGGHGFGMGLNGGTESTWPEALLFWLKELKYL